MGAAIGTDDKKGVNVELNVVPFIDLMSCLTAFLLVTAVWVNISDLNVSPQGKARDGKEPIDQDPQLSVLIENDGIWVGVSRINELQHIPKTASGYDWAKLEATLKEQKGSSYFSNVADIEVAAESTQAQPVSYQEMVLAMDTAVKAGFPSVHISDPEGLAARPRS
ncbi:MAG TPA: biopolymer transporter ExbD [Kofleriaceae bacterium]|jgi:biopolymer transport protein ExbD